MAEKNISVRLGARVDAYVAAMRAANASTTNFSRATQRNLRTVGSQMQNVGRMATTFVSVPIAAAGAFAIKAAVDWESAWAGVTKTVDGTTQQLADLEQGLRDMSKEIPASHREIAAVAEAAGALGVATEDIEFFTRTMLDLGETTDLTSDQAATSIAQMMNVMQTAPDDVDNLASALVHLGNNGASTESQILDMATRIAGAGAIVGLQEHEVLGFANALASMGIEAEAGGSAFSRVITEISKAVSQGGEDLDTFAQVAGVSSAQFAQSFRDDPAMAIVSFIDGLGRIQRAGGDVFTVLDLLGLADVRVSRALLSMTTSGDLLTTSLRQGEQAWRDNTALADEAAKRYDTAAARFEIVRNKIVDLFIDLGNIMLPAVEKVVDVIGMLAEDFQRLPQPIQIAVGGILGLVAAMGPTVFIAGTLIKNLQLVTGTLSKVGPAAATAGRALGLIGVAAGAAYFAFEFFTRSQELATTHIDTASDALANETVATYNAAVAAGQATTQVDALAIAHLALSNAISEAADDELEKALSTLNITTEETLDVLTQLGSGSLPTIRTEMSRLTQEFFGISAAQADVALNMRAQGAAYEDVASAIGQTTETVAAWDEALSTTTRFADQNKQEINDLALAYLNGQARIPGFASEALLAAEAIAGNRNEAMNAIPVYEEYIHQLTLADPALAQMALTSNAMVSSIDELVPGLESAGGAASDAAGGFEELVTVQGSAIDTMSTARQYAADFAEQWRMHSEALDTALGNTRNFIRSHDEWAGVLLGFTDEIEHASAGIDWNTEAGLANRDAIYEAADALIDLTKANLEHGIGAEETTRQYKEGREALLDQAEAAGLDRDAVDELISTYGLVPDLVVTTIDIAGQALAEWAIQRHLERLNEIPEDQATEIETAINQGDYNRAWELIHAFEAGADAPIRPYLTQTRFNVTVSASGSGIGSRVGSVGIGYAEGGYIGHDHIAQLHSPEVVLPLDNPVRMTELLGMAEVGPRVAAAMSKWMPMHGWSGSSAPVPAPTAGGDVNHYYDVSVVMPPGADGDDVLRALKTLERRIGPLPLKVRS